MGYRNIIISSNSNISVKNAQLLIGTVGIIPIEDINSVLIENQHVNISAYTLQLLADNNIVVYFCNQKHTPNAVLLPIVGHSRHLKMLTFQINCGKPLKKRLWQKIVIAKISNQAKCLELVDDVYGARHLYSMRKKVVSGDTGNIEAQAAAYYFKRLYGSTFVRSQANVINASLNYGYAIVRGVIARSIIYHGYEPSVGIFHRSEQNSFNLADDFIEPFRQIVDLVVYDLIEKEDKDELTPTMKRVLYSVLKYDLEIDSKKQILSNAADIMIESYSRSLMENNVSLLVPTLIGLAEHSYE